MKFLIDNAISPIVSDMLNEIGHQSIHIKEIGLQHAKDEEIFDRALKDGSVIITADTDFGYLLTKWNENKPSIIIFRKGVERDPLQQINLLKANLKANVLNFLEKGSLVIIEDKRVRIKSLPIYKE